MKYTIKVCPTTLYLTPRLPQNLLEIIQKKLSYMPKGYQYTNVYKSGVWDGRKKLFNKRYQSAPSGCYKRLYDLLVKHGHNVNIVFEREYKPKGDGEIHDLMPFDFQEKAANVAIKNKIGVLDAAVRAGKTLVFSLILSKIDHYPTTVVTFGKDLVAQTRQELNRFLKKDIGYFSEGKYVAGDILVTSYQALARVYPASGQNSRLSDELKKRNKEIQKHIEATKVLILDECQYIFSKNGRKIINKFKNTGYRIALSGTSKPDGITYVEAESVIGPKLLKVSFDKLIKIGRIAQPIIHLYSLPYCWFRSYLSEYEDIYEANIVQNMYRNYFIRDIVEELNRKNKTVYIMVRRKAHGEILRELIPNSVYIYGKIKADVRKTLYNSLQKRDLSCIIATVGKVGLNLPNLDAVINAEGLAAKTITIQKMRSLTASDEKSVGLVIDFIDKGKYLLEHSETRENIYKKQKGFIIKEKKVPSKYFDKRIKNEEM